MFEKQRNAFSKIIVRRHLYQDYDDPELLKIEIAALKGEIGSVIELYCYPQQLLEIGKILYSFPTKYRDEYCYEEGSEDPAKRFLYFFKMRIYTYTPSECAIEFSMHLNLEEPYGYKTNFTLYPLYASDLRRLGESFMTFSELKLMEFEWSSHENFF